MNIVFHVVQLVLLSQTHVIKHATQLSSSSHKTSQDIQAGIYLLTIYYYTMASYCTIAYSIIAKCGTQVNTYNKINTSATVKQTNIDSL